MLFYHKLFFTFIYLITLVLIGLNLSQQQEKSYTEEFKDTTDVKDFNDTWMYMPDGEGNAQVAYLTEPPNEIDNENQLDHTSQSIHFEFYGRLFN